MKVLVTQWCLTLCDPVDCSSPGSLCSWDSPGKNTGVGCHFLLQGIFLTQGLNLGLPHCRQTFYLLITNSNMWGDFLMPSSSSPTPYQWGVLQFNSILTLSTQRQQHIPQTKGSVPQDGFPFQKPITGPGCHLWL